MKVNQNSKDAVLSLNVKQYQKLYETIDWHIKWRVRWWEGPFHDGTFYQHTWSSNICALR